MRNIVVKFGRTQWFCCLPMEWYSRLMHRHEESIYKAIAGAPGVPRWGGMLPCGGYAIEYIDSLPLDHFKTLPAGFFDKLRDIFAELHRRGIAYCDANKRSNILVTPSGEPFLVDYQVSLQSRINLPWPFNALWNRFIRYLQGRDLYHLYKHKRRLAPAELTPQEDALSRQRGPIHKMHRLFLAPYKAVRRWFLGKQFREGKLASPTKNMEDHFQPEKSTWRKKDAL